MNFKQNAVKRCSGLHTYLRFLFKSKQFPSFLQFILSNVYGKLLYCKDNTIINYKIVWSSMRSCVLTKVRKLLIAGTFHLRMCITEKLISCAVETSGNVMIADVLVLTMGKPLSQTRNDTLLNFIISPNISCCIHYDIANNLPYVAFKL